MLCRQCLRELFLRLPAFGKRLRGSRLYEFPEAGSRTAEAPLSPRAGEFLLGRAGSASQNAEDFVFLHDDEVFAINLDFSAGVLSKQDAVALFHGQREGFAFVVGPTLAGGDDFALLGLVLG